MKIKKQNDQQGNQFIANVSVIKFKPSCTKRTLYEYIDQIIKDVDKVNRLC